MPSLAENAQIWRSYDWSAGGGDEWSEVWGGPDQQWFGSLLPRIQDYVPAGRILEIAPGFGRWTHYLKELCEKLIVVDMTERCIEACKARFAAERHLEYHVNDGRSLGMIEDGSLDFVFSFDSLVHADLQPLHAYESSRARWLRMASPSFTTRTSPSTSSTSVQSSGYRRAGELSPAWG